MAQRNTDEQHTNRPQQGKDDKVQRSVQKWLLNGKYPQYFTGKKAAEATPKGKRAENKGELHPGNLPFLLQPAKHAHEDGVKKRADDGIQPGG